MRATPPLRYQSRSSLNSHQSATREVTVHRISSTVFETRTHVAATRKANVVDLVIEPSYVEDARETRRLWRGKFRPALVKSGPRVFS